MTDQQSSMGRQDTEHATPFGTHDSVITPEEDSTTRRDTTSEERIDTSPPVPQVTEVLQHWTASCTHACAYTPQCIPYPSNQGDDDEGDHQSSPADQDIPSGDHDRSSAHQDGPLDDQDTPTIPQDIPQDTTDEDRIETLPQITEVLHGLWLHT